MANPKGFIDRTLPRKNPVVSIERRQGKNLAKNDNLSADHEVNRYRRERDRKESSLFRRGREKRDQRHRYSTEKEKLEEAKGNQRSRFHSFEVGLVCRSR